MSAIRSVIIALLVVGLIGSCSDKPSEPKSEYSERNLMARAEQMYQSFVDGEIPLPDAGTEKLPGIDLSPDIIYDTTYDIYVIVTVWGAIDLTNWSGNLRTQTGNRLHLVHLIDFEEGEDGLSPILAIYGPELFSWHSTTENDIDGLLMLLLVEKTSDIVTIPTVESSLRFETTPVTEEWYVSELVDFAGFYPVRSGGMVMLARKLPRMHCPTGTFEGDWIKASPAGDSGTIQGWWLNDSGDTTGSLGGQFWTSNEDRRHFKFYISAPTATVVLGEAYGSWRYDDPSLCPTCGEGRGIFTGRFRMGETHGRLRGVFGEIGLPFDQLELEMSGEWKGRCQPDFQTDHWNHQ